MTGKTHWVVGITTALCVLQPTNLKEWGIGVGAAMVGSVISDIDVHSSHSQKILNRVIKIAVAAALVLAFVEYRFRIGILQAFSEEDGIFRAFVGLFAFLLMCAVGKNSPHRSFTHSFLGWAILSGIVYFISPLAAPYFAVAMLSHILLDLLNRRKVRLLYPLKKGICFSVCKSDGALNQLLLHVGTAAFLFVSVFLLAIK